MRTPLVVLCLLTLVPAVARSADSIQARGGIEIVAVTSSVEGALLALEDRRGDEVSRGITDRFGSYLFTEVKPGPGYVVRNLADGGAQTVTVLDFEDHPAQSFYQAPDPRGGLQLHPDARRDAARRDGAAAARTIARPRARSRPSSSTPATSAADPDTPQPSTLLASALGYATVGVNMRGSGCSGGVIDLFDLPTTADGYDVVETVAAQSWVQDGKVGMIGISFPGISQLFVGGRAAAAPRARSRRSR